MKRAILLLTIVLLPHVAEAKIAVVKQRNRFQTQFSASLPSRATDYQYWTDWTTAHIVGFLNRYGRIQGRDYDIYQPEQVQTSLAAVGSIAGQTYTAIIWSGMEAATTTATNPTVGCYPCSTAMTTYSPTVHQVFVHNGDSEGMSTGACSLGTAAQGLDPNSQGPGFGDAVVFPTGRPTLKFHRTWNVGGRSTVSPAGGLRVILGVKAGAHFVDRDSTENATFTADHFGIGASPSLDSANAFAWHVMERLNAHKAGMGRSIFVNWATAAQTRMVGPSADLDAVTNHGDPFPIYFALAYLDSLTNGDVLGDNLTPVRFAIEVDGLASRSSGWDHGRGMRPQDTTAVFASFDSLATLGAPITFGVNIDSVAAYQSELNKALTIRTARFAPFIRTGIDTAVLTAANGRTGPLNVVDLMGRYRNRSFVTPVNPCQCDSSITNLATWARQRIDSITGGRSTGVIMAPDDDWSPKNITEQSGDIDSLVYALRLAGYSAISFNVDADTINRTVPTNPIGRTMGPRFFRNRYGDKSPFGFVAHTKVGRRPHSAPWGGGAQFSGDSVWAPFAVYKMWQSAYVGRWNVPEKEMFTRTGRSTDWAEPHSTFSITPNVSPVAATERPVNVLRLSTVGLGQGVAPTGQQPARAGFYAAKSLVNMVNSLNYISGKTLAQIVYTDQLQPTDLR